MPSLSITDAVITHSPHSIINKLRCHAGCYTATSFILYGAMRRIIHVRHPIVNLRSSNEKIDFLLGSCRSFYGVQAADERDASLLVKKYSETVACQLEGAEEFNKSQYKAVTVKPGFADLGGMGAVFVVAWAGDIGCYGGNGSVVQNFTVVEHSGFSSADPVVKLDYKFPELSIVELTSMSGGDGLLVINGVTYGDSDRQHQPRKVVSYTLKLVENEFVKQ